MQKTGVIWQKKSQIEQLLQKNPKKSILGMLWPFWPAIPQNFEFSLIFCNFNVLIIFVREIYYDEKILCFCLYSPLLLWNYFLEECLYLFVLINLGEWVYNSFGAMSNLINFLLYSHCFLTFWQVFDTLPVCLLRVD